MNIILFMNTILMNSILKIIFISLWIFAWIFGASDSVGGSLLKGFFSWLTLVPLSARELASCHCGLSSAWTTGSILCNFSSSRSAWVTFQNDLRSPQLRLKCSVSLEVCAQIWNAFTQTIFQQSTFWSSKQIRWTEKEKRWALLQSHIWKATIQMQRWQDGMMCVLSQIISSVSCSKILKSAIKFYPDLYL